jgi:hypothetical protein
VGAVTVRLAVRLLPETEKLVGREAVPWPVEIAPGVPVELMVGVADVKVRAILPAPPAPPVPLLALDD